ncbi:MAG TPA: hypothetical protein VEH27_18080 [Methylomirabilota bacterium]|nr:hypothetical protein [Methylomirabilota bacterium]
MKLNRRSLLSIKEALDDSCFGSEAFMIRQLAEEDGVLHIGFRDDETFKFFIGHNSDAGTHGFYSPGDVTEEHTFILNEPTDTFITSVVFHIQDWLRNLAAELEAKQALARRDKLANALFGEFEKRVKDTQEPFTPSEIIDLRKKLDAFQVAMEAQKTEVALNATEIEKLKSVIADLKASLEVLPKKTWQRSFLSKLADYGVRWATSEEGQRAIGEAAKTILS